LEAPSCLELDGGLESCHSGLARRFNINLERGTAPITLEVARGRLPLGALPQERICSSRLLAG